MSYETLEAAVQALTTTNAQLVDAVTTAQGRLDTSVVESEAAADAAQASQAAAGTSAATATAQATIATTQAGIATTQAGIATTQAGLSTESATQAATQAELAETYADAVNGKVFASYADAYAAMASLVDGDLIRVLVDETAGNQGTWYRFSLDDGASLVLDFAGDFYFVGGFVRVRTEQQFASVPLTSTSAGFAGQIAANTTHLYVAVANNSWKRVALETF